jgi:hypothetical protein
MTPLAKNASARAAVPMEPRGVSRIEGTERWSYGAFDHDNERGPIRIELLRDDGTSAEFTVPDFVNAPQDLRQIAIVVIGALEKWEDVQGLGG